MHPGDRASAPARQPRRWIALRVLGVFATLGAAVACSQDSAAPPPPGRIILLSMDTVRADHVSGYGDASTTPALLEVAQEGVIFRRAYAASNYTIPAHMSIFTGLDPAEHGVSRMYAELDPEVATLASILRDTGYRTQSFNEGVYVNARFGFDRGFDDYEEVTSSLVGDRSLMRITHWMQKHRNEPYLLFLHTYIAHFPYGGYEEYRRSQPGRGLPSREELLRRSAALPPGAEDVQLHYLCTLYNQLADSRSGLLPCGDNRPDERFVEQPHFEADRAAIRRGYEARVRLIDRSVRAIRGALTKLGQWEDTLLVVTSDHGEAFFEHGLYRHAFAPFDEVLHIPLIVSYPRLLRSGPVRTVDGLVSHLDLLPTILGLAGVAPPPGLPPLQGMDLGPVLRGQAEIPEQRAVYPAVLRAAQMEQVPLRRVVVRGTRKAIQGHALFGDSQGYLFDLEQDPGERKNLREARNADFEALTRLGSEFEAGLVRTTPVDQRTGHPLALQDAAAPTLDGLGPEERERLRALGYGD